jgi:radical SAM protein with 4Fe4S-binding SPASM domain
MVEIGCEVDVPLARVQGRLRAPPSLQVRCGSSRKESADTPLRRISIELSRRCNLHCVYCYAGASRSKRGGLTDSEVRAIIDEAVGAGACMISIVGGGEPLLRSTLTTDGESCIDYANRMGCYCHVYTNCTLVDVKVARWMRGRDLSVIGKLNSLDERLQDALAGVAGSAVRMRRGIDALLGAGMAQGPEPRLGLETIVCRQNYDEAPALWRFMRERGIVPEVEIPTLQGRAKDNREGLYFDDEEASRKYRELFEELLRIDREEFGFDWVPQPPFPAMSCRLYYSNCYINDRGGVQPCAGVDKEYGFLRVGRHARSGQPLAEIVSSPAFQQLRRIHEHVKEPCRSCELLEGCYGCRGAAFHQTGDLFAGDPVCWRREKLVNRERGIQNSEPTE